jgi:hypothetical protein
MPDCINAGLQISTFPFQGRRVTWFYLPCGLGLSWPHAPWRALVALLFAYKTLSWLHISFTNLPITSISLVLLPVVEAPGWSDLFFCIDSLLLDAKLTPQPQLYIKLATSQKPCFICRFSSASAATSLLFQQFPSGPFWSTSLKLSCRNLQFSHLLFFHLRTLNCVDSMNDSGSVDRTRCLSLLSSSANLLPGLWIWPSGNCRSWVWNSILSQTAWTI